MNESSLLHDDVPASDIAALGYSTHDIAKRCNVTARQAQRIARSVLGPRSRYRLTKEEFDRVHFWHAKWGYSQLSVDEQLKTTRPISVR